jgi:hypothetical protein
VDRVDVLVPAAKSGAGVVPAASLAWAECAAVSWAAVALAAVRAFSAVRVRSAGVPGGSDCPEAAWSAESQAFGSAGLEVW